MPKLHCDLNVSCRSTVMCVNVNTLRCEHYEQVLKGNQMAYVFVVFNNNWNWEIAITSQWFTL